MPSAALFPDLPKAIERVEKALREKEVIAIFGDYDCDGVTSSAILHRYFARRGVTPHILLPHRERDGYGLAAKHIRILLEKKVTLLLTVDTGVTALVPIHMAKDAGIDVIVLDHHTLPNTLPPATAILHPALAPDFPKPHPCAAGVALMFVKALEKNVEWSEREVDIALAAIGTVADLVPLEGGNRTLVQAGLKALENIKTGPLKALTETARSGEEPLTSRAIAFRIAPRLNAAGRMADPQTALHALLGDEAALHSLHALNSERQDLTRLLMEHALETVMKKSSTPFIFLASHDYPAGIVGLLAGRLTEMFGKPSLVGTIIEGSCRASLRSIPSYNVMEGLNACSAYLSNFGGHAQAAGCTFAVTDIPIVEKILCDHLADKVSSEFLVPTLMIDAELVPEQFTVEDFAQLTSLEPYGQGNPEPRFLLSQAKIERTRRVGADGAHLQAMIGHLPAIGFHLGSLAEQCTQPLDVACRLMVDTWQGRAQPKIVMEDVRVPVMAAASV